MGYGGFESLDGQSWTLQSLPTRHPLEGAAYSPPLDRFVAVGDSVITYTNDALPILSIADVSAEENTGTASFTVTLSAASGRAITVKYASANGSALAPADYTVTSGTLAFVPGETSQTIAVPLVGDLAYELGETFTVTLSAPTNAALGDASGVGTIQNDDPAPVLKVPIWAELSPCQSCTRWRGRASHSTLRRSAKQ